ncbi:MAG: serine protease [Pseudonocardiaceae bacterium]
MHHRIVNGPRRAVRTVVTGAAMASAAAVASLAVLVPGTAAALVPATEAGKGPAWAPAAQATVHPGVMTITNGGECTANFIFTNATDVFIGQAAHCAGTGAPTETSGCTAGTKPLGTPVTIVGASKPGTLVYSSWITMAQRGEKDANTCDYNDLALVKIDRADLGKVNPSVPFFGGPTGITTSPTAVGDGVLTYGNSPLRAGISALSPKQGIIVGGEGDGWSHICYTATPGVPGDSGSAVLAKDGKALGVLTSLGLAPLAGSNGIGDLSRELNYLNAHGGLGAVSLALGTESFHSPLPS